MDNLNAININNIPDKIIFNQDLDISGSLDVSGISTFSGTTTINTTGNEKLILSGSSNPYIQFQEGTTNKAYLQWSSGGGYVQLGNEENSTVIRILSGETGLVYRVGSNNRTVWTSGNDGASSGLDADLLDGQEGSYYTNAANLTGVISVEAKYINAVNTIVKSDEELYFYSTDGKGFIRDIATKGFDLKNKSKRSLNDSMKLIEYCLDRYGSKN